VETPKAKPAASSNATSDADQSETGEIAETPVPGKSDWMVDDSGDLPNVLTDDLRDLSIEAFLQFYELKNATATQADDGNLTISFDYTRKLAPPPGRRFHCLVGISRNPPRWLPVDLKDESGRYDLVYGPVFAKPGPRTQILIEIPPYDGNGPRRVSNLLDVTLPDEVKLTPLPKRVIDPKKPRAQSLGRTAELPVLPDPKGSAP
jgi:hypothetical protein